MAARKKGEAHPRAESEGEGAPMRRVRTEGAAERTARMAPAEPGSWYCANPWEGRCTQNAKDALLSFQATADKKACSAACRAPAVLLELVRGYMAAEPYARAWQAGPPPYPPLHAPARARTLSKVRIHEAAGADALHWLIDRAAVLRDVMSAEHINDARRAQVSAEHDAIIGLARTLIQEGRGSHAALPVVLSLLKYPFDLARLAPAMLASVAWRTALEDLRRDEVAQRALLARARIPLMQNLFFYAGLFGPETLAKVPEKQAALQVLARAIHVTDPKVAEQAFAPMWEDPMLGSGYVPTPAVLAELIALFGCGIALPAARRLDGAFEQARVLQSLKRPPAPPAETERALLAAAQGIGDVLRRAGCAIPIRLTAERQGPALAALQAALAP